jgi:lipoprotein-anchoring transpeptidase ErfK/SrfK
MQTKIESRKDNRKAAILFAALLLSANLMAQPLPNAESRQSGRQVVVSIPDRKLALIENGDVKRVFPVAVGKQSTPSPAGSFHIVNRVTNPAYYHEGKIVSAGPANPVGTRWMGLSEHGYGIHGTNSPSSIGKAASHGCIRMARADLEELFNLLEVGDAVEIRAERDEETMRLFGGGETLLAAAGTQPEAGE